MDVYYVLYVNNSKQHTPAWCCTFKAASKHLKALYYICMCIYTLSPTHTFIFKGIDIVKIEKQKLKFVNGT